MNKIYVDLETIRYSNFLNEKYNNIKNSIEKLKDKKGDVYENLLLDEAIYENYIKKLKYLIDNNLDIDEDDDDTVEKIHKEWLLNESVKVRIDNLKNTGR